MTAAAWWTLVGVIFSWAVRAVIHLALASYQDRLVKRKSADLQLSRHVVTLQQLEADTARPLSELIAEAEEKALLETQLPTTAEHDERGLRLVHGRHVAFSDCIDCGKEAIYTKGLREPVAWVLTDPCPLHR